MFYHNITTSYSFKSTYILYKYNINLVFLFLNASSHVI